MPTNQCKADLQNLTFNKLTGLKAFWGFSKSAIIYKAKFLGFINEATYKYMMIELSRRGERKSEYGFVEVDKPTTIQQVITLLHQELEYTEMDIAEKLCINLSDYLRLFNPPVTEEPKVKIRHLKTAI